MSQRDTIQRPYGIHKRLESQPKVETPGGKGIQDKGESSHYPSKRRKTELDSTYSDLFSLKRSKPTRLPSGFTSLRYQKISDQEYPFFKIPGGFHERTRIKREKPDLFQPEAERVRPHDTESFGLG
ncbi:hypothetical protein O181_036221 [Austropuccinia psidii MF-1]|uniref:Uncharacterized protein n=1 Tax=Austropuccinia psidii MF-1 TaxID=1389203 RepID=A0A9Q3D9T1_9BASI|nr:hypothetical protein [Austropuccinia psidii MF-1]